MTAKSYRLAVDPQTRQAWGRFHRRQGHLTRACRDFAVAEAAARDQVTAGDAEQELLRHIQLDYAEVLRRLGQSQRALAILDDITQGTTDLVANANPALSRLVNLARIDSARIELELGNLTQAQNLLATDVTGDQPDVRYQWWLAMAELAWTVSDLDAAQHRIMRARGAQSGTPWDALCDGHEVVILGMLGREDEAERIGNKAAASLRQSGWSHEAARIDLAVAHALADGARHRRAITQAQATRQEFLAVGSPLDLAECDRVIGACHVALGNWRYAHDSLQSALRLHQRLGRTHDALQIQIELSELALAMGQIASAVRTLHSALEALTRKGAQWDEAECHLLVATALLDDRNGPLISTAAKRAIPTLSQRHDDIIEHARRAETIFRHAGAVDKSAYSKLIVLTCRGLAGEAGSVNEVIAIAADPELSLEVRAEAQRVVAAFHIMVGRDNDAIAAFKRSAELFSHAAMPLEVPWSLVECARVRADTDVSDALELILTPLLDIGLMAPQLASASERTYWQGRVTEAASLAFQWAHQLDEERLLAELIEFWRNLRVPLIPTTSMRSRRRQRRVRWVPGNHNEAALREECTLYPVREIHGIPMPDGALALEQWWPRGENGDR